MQGAVRSIVRFDEKVFADVDGSEPWPYEVAINLADGKVGAASCTCPYDFGGWCKHIVAVLLACLRTPEAVLEQEGLGASLEQLEAPQLRQLLLDLAASQPAARDWLGRRLGAGAGHPQSLPVTGAKRLAGANDASIYARRVSAALHSLDRMRSSDAYWHVGEVVEEVRNLLDEAYEALDAQQADRAVAILDAITDAYLEEWEILDDSSGEASALFEDLFAVWLEVLLSLDDPDPWLDRIEGRAEDLAAEYGIGDDFLVAASVAARGWDSPALQAVLQGRLVPGPGHPTSLRTEPELVTDARLRVLARQGKLEEYVRLADFFGRAEACCAMLVELGQLDQALQYGLRRLDSAASALSIANQLAERGAKAAALSLAEHGLTLPGSKAQLAGWLQGMAEREGKHDLALTAAIVCFKDLPCLSAYLDVEAAASAKWSDVRAELLEFLHSNEVHGEPGAVEVLLHEGMVDEAIEHVKEHETWDYRLTELVAEAAIGTRPEWSAGVGCRQAESIINAGRADLYAIAINWLRIVKRAMLAADGEQAWQDYLASLMAQHRRKYKLLPMLQALAR